MLSFVLLLGMIHYYHFTSGSFQAVKRRKAWIDQVSKDRFDELYMREALLEAKKVANVGVVLVFGGKIMARGYNRALHYTLHLNHVLCVLEQSFKHGLPQLNGELSISNWEQCCQVFLRHVIRNLIIVTGEDVLVLLLWKRSLGMPAETIGILAILTADNTKRISITIMSNQT
ncbi:hypothetical protein L6452_20761 [Arctium lappa]|uniref:Uncharacterized protein n=1 Tax=Arctium lappa TaxID=4217 RepID=A0ACB9BC96_ARCLA|nr:hypothetical protein L6452_20761 [Arctium lappa]